MNIKVNWRLKAITIILFIPFSVDLPDKNIIYDERMYDMLA